MFVISRFDCIGTGWKSKYTRLRSEATEIISYFSDHTVHELLWLSVQPLPSVFQNAFLLEPPPQLNKVNGNAAAEPQQLLLFSDAAQRFSSDLVTRQFSATSQMQSNDGAFLKQLLIVDIKTILDRILYTSDLCALANYCQEPSPFAGSLTIPSPFTTLLPLLYCLS